MNLLGMGDHRISSLADIFVSHLEKCASKRDCEMFGYVLCFDCRH